MLDGSALLEDGSCFWVFAFDVKISERGGMLYTFIFLLWHIPNAHHQQLAVYTFIYT